MARLETWYKQDLKRPLVVHKHTDVFNQDSMGNLIGVEVYSDGEPVALSGSISGYCLLADGTTVPAVGASRSGNKASVLIPQTAYSVPGPITITIKNVDGENIATLCATVGIVRQSVSGNLVNPGSVVTDWSNDINAQLQAVQTAVDNVGAIVAAPFDENTVYAVGNYVTNNGNLYRITADHVSGVAWANTAKVQCTVGHELEALNNHFVADWNLIDPDSASGNETDFLPVELNVRYNIIHAQSKGRFQYGLSFYDSNKTMLYISQLVDESTDGTNYSYSCTFSQSAIAYVKLKINSAPSGIDTTDFSKVYFGKGSEYIEFADYNVIHAIKKVKDDVADLASDVSDLNSALGTVPSGKTVQGQIDDNANDISDLKSAISSDLAVNSLPENKFNAVITSAQITNAAGKGIATHAEYNKIFLNGTATSGFDIMLQDGTAGCYDLDPTMYYYVISDTNLNGKIEINFGYFDASQGAHNGTNVAVFDNNVPSEISYASGAVKARNYIKIINGASFNNVVIAVIGVKELSPILNIHDILLNLNQINAWNKLKLNGESLNSQKANALSKGITLTFEENRVKLIGTANANFSIQLTANKYELTNKMTYLIQFEGTYTDGKLLVYNTYFDGSGNAHNYQEAKAYNKPYIVDYPSEAKKSRDYVNLKSGATYNVTITLFSWDGIALYKKADDGYNCNELLSGSSWNSALHNGLSDFETPITRFSALVGQGNVIDDIPGVAECENFIFFTDPHIMAAAGIAKFNDYMGQIEKVYNTAPVTFVLCGGDWLGNSDLPAEASYKMGLIDGTCRSMFKRYYPLVGNHDTNYQGKKTAESATGTTLFPLDAINNLWYRDIGKAYYTFKGVNTTFYCFDSQSGTNVDDEDYFAEQTVWFMKALEDETSDHIAVAIHIFFTTTEMTTASVFASRIMAAAHAYNQRTTLSQHGYDADYTNATGMVEFVIAGHTHRDNIAYATSGNSTIPVIVTVDTGYTGYNDTFKEDASFDLVFANYDSRKVKLVRVGSGSDREANMAVVSS